MQEITAVIHYVRQAYLLREEVVDFYHNHLSRDRVKWKQFYSKSRTDQEQEHLKKVLLRSMQCRYLEAIQIASEDRPRGLKSLL